MPQRSMSPQGIGSSAFSSAALRRLRTVSRQNQAISSQLATGQRITSTSEDAVGLALASRLQSRNSQLAQSAQSVSQGTTLLSIGEAALREINDVITAMSDLATQATDKTLTRAQRLELQEETDQLTAEFNRIVNSAELYGVKVLDRSTTALTVSASPDRQGGITTNFTQDLSTTVGNNIFTNSSTSYGFATDAVAADFNNDGRMDLAVNNQLSGAVNRYLGTASGGFSTIASVSSGVSGGTLLAGDVTGDGLTDLVKIASGGSRTTISVLRNLGVNGTFTVASLSTENSTPNTNGAFLADLNGDNKQDVIFGSLSRGGVFVKLAGSGGALGSSTQVFSSSSFEFNVADFTGDNIPDLVAVTTGGVTLTGKGYDLKLYAGNGNGGFSNTGSTISDLFTSNLFAADFNRDGLTDLAFTSTITELDEGLGEFTTTRKILLNQGGGTFSQTFSGVDNTVNLIASRAADLNGDGNIDLIAPLTGAMQVAFGRGDGTFASAQTISTGLRTPRTFADFNGDGVADLIGTGTSVAAQISFQGTRRTTQIATFSLTNATNAATTVTQLSNVQTRVLKELGAISSAQMRLGVAYDAIDATRRVNSIAVGRILDVDKAELEAKLTAGKIRERSAEAIFAQANQSAATVSSLLDLSSMPKLPGLADVSSTENTLVTKKPISKPVGLSSFGDPNRSRLGVLVGQSVDDQQTNQLGINIGSDTAELVEL